MHRMKISSHEWPFEIGGCKVNGGTWSVSEPWIKTNGCDIIFVMVLVVINYSFQS